MINPDHLSLRIPFPSQEKSKERHTLRTARTVTIGRTQMFQSSNLVELLLLLFHVAISEIRSAIVSTVSTLPVSKVCACESAPARAAMRWQPSCSLSQNRSTQQPFGPPSVGVASPRSANTSKRFAKGRVSETVRGLALAIMRAGATTTEVVAEPLTLGPLWILWGF